MSTGITQYVEPPTRITSHVDMGVLEPEPVHAGWTNFASQRSVRAVAAARHSGQLWLATWGGVLVWNRQAERYYRRYSSEHGLAGNAVACLCLDRDERAWVGQIEGGLSIFEGPGFHAYPYLSHEPIRALAPGPSGVWVAGAEAIYLVNGVHAPPITVVWDDQRLASPMALLENGDGVLVATERGLFSVRVGSAPQRLFAAKIQACTAIAGDAAELMWLGTPDGVYRIEKGTTIVGPFDSDQPDGLRRISALAAGRTSAWALSLGGLGRVIDNRWVGVPIPEDLEPQPVPRAIGVGADDSSAWVGTDDLLASVRMEKFDPAWEPSLLPPHREDALNNLARCLLADEVNGRVWVGTAGGLARLGPGDECVQIDTDLDVRALAPTSAADVNSAIWVLAWPSGIGRLDRSHRLDFNVANQPPGLTMAIAVGQDGRCYAVTRRGLWVIRPNVTEVLSGAVPALPTCLAQMPDETWWVGTARGVYRLILGGWELAGDATGPGQSAVLAMGVVHGELWVGASQGLWSRRGDGWHAHRPWGPGLHTSLQADQGRVSAVAAASAGSNVWVAGNLGVVKYDPIHKTSSQMFTPANSGLASRRVTAMVEDSGALWIATEAGVSRFATA